MADWGQALGVPVTKDVKELIVFVRKKRSRGLVFLVKILKAAAATRLWFNAP